MHTLAESIHPFGDDSHVTRYMYHLQDNTQFDLDPFHLLNHLMQPWISGRAADMMQRIEVHLALSIMTMALACLSSGMMSLGAVVMSKINPVYVTA
jgi:hypothetical protein